MTLELLHRNFMIELDKLSLSSYPSFLKEEIDYWINQAIEVFVKTRYSGVNARGKAFQQDQKRSDDLRTLVKSQEYFKKPEDPDMVDPATDYLSPYSADHFGAKYPSDYLMSVGETVYVSSDKKCWPVGKDGNPAIKRVDVMEATIENVDMKLSNSLSDHRYNQTGMVRPIRVQTLNEIQLHTDGNYSIDKYVLTYLKEPPKVKWNFEDLAENKSQLDTMPEHTWSEIIVIAVAFAIENISDSRNQTYGQKAQVIE